MTSTRRRREGRAAHPASAAGGTLSVDRLVVLGVLGRSTPPPRRPAWPTCSSATTTPRGLEVLPIGTPTNNTAAERSGFTGPDDPVASFRRRAAHARAAPEAATAACSRARSASRADAFRGVAGTRATPSRRRPGR